MVAIEFAASFMPLRKSNASAIAISVSKSGSARVPASIVFALRRESDVLDDDTVHYVGDVIETVNHLFEMVVHLVADVEGKPAAAYVGAIKLPQALVVQFIG